MNIHIAQLVGESCITADSGKKVYAHAIPAIASGQKVVLDFDGVKHVSALFLNFAIASIYEAYPEDKIHELLEIDNFPPYAVPALKLGVAQATSIRKNPQLAVIIRDAVNKVVEECF